MKTIHYGILLFLLIIAGTNVFGQRMAVREEVVVGRPRHARAELVVRSRYRPASVMVYHPYWGPRFVYHRRWIYFPRYNVYWDNWRNVYVFRNGRVWVSQTALPPVLVNVNLSRTRAVELNEKEDDADDIYQSNDIHKLQNQ